MSDIKRTKAAPLPTPTPAYSVSVEAADKFHHAMSELMWYANEAADQYMAAVRHDASMGNYMASMRMIECQRELNRLHYAITRFQDKYANEA
jgi:hypothetical protein